MSDDTKKGDDPKPADEAEEPKTEEPKAEEPQPKAESEAPEEPKAEEPQPKTESEAPEEPKAEEPKAEEPKAEEPKAEEPQPKAESAAPESPGEKLAAGDPGAKLREEEKAEEPKAEEPKAEEPKAEEPKAEEPSAGESYPVETAPARPQWEQVSPALVNVGTLIEFETEESLMAACEKVRDAGWTRWDAHTPYPVHGLDAKMGIKPTLLPWIVLAGGLTGCFAGLALQFYTNGIELPFSISDTIADPFLPSGYAFVTSGKPIFSVPANIPVTFELTILFSAFASFFGMWGLNKLPQFWHPVFQSTRFRRATNDRFFVSLEAADPLYHPDRAQEFAETLGGSHVEALIGEEE